VIGEFYAPPLLSRENKSPKLTNKKVGRFTAGLGVVEGRKITNLSRKSNFGTSVP
jgi:hypothetical protein